MTFAIVFQHSSFKITFYPIKLLPVPFILFLQNRDVFLAQ
jgi:hypothetical protein